MLNSFPVWLQNPLISARLKPILSHTEKSIIVMYYIQFSMNIKMYNHYIKTSFVRSCLWQLGAKKTGFNLIIIHFYIGGKLFILGCDK